jgi:glycosyltransferase involved in cell wall biosynthesis
VDEVMSMTDLDCVPIGGSVDVDLFRPRPRLGSDWPERPVRVAAMVRPESAYRNPERTMRALAALKGRLGADVQILLYGTEPDNPLFLKLPRDFEFQLLGRLDQRSMAALFNEVDIFADFSVYQAFGMAAVEAMSTGVAVIVPYRGGTDAYARHEENALAIDTASLEACTDALVRLSTDHELRRKLQRRAIYDAPLLFHEAPTARLLDALFSGSES